MLPSFAYARARSVDEAVKGTKAAGAHVMAGGTDLLTCLREGILPAEKVVSLQDLEGLRRVRRDRGGLAIGALVPIARVADSADVARLYPVLAQAAGAVGSPQLRNQGTIGGNLNQRPRCWYYRGDFPCVRRGGAFCSAMTGQNQFHCIFGGATCVYVHPSDTAPALTALDATVAIAGPGDGREVEVRRLFVLPEDDATRETVLEPGEIVTEVRIPAPPEGARSSYRKVRSRGAWDFAVVSSALVLAFEGGGRIHHARVVLGGVAPVPWRAEQAEAELVGGPLTPDAAARAAKAAMADALALDHNAAKIDIGRGLLEAELLRLGGDR